MDAFRSHGQYVSRVTWQDEIRAPLVGCNPIRDSNPSENRMTQGFEDNFKRQQLSDHLNALVEQELENGEVIRWFGQPIRSHYRRLGLPLVLFGIPWTAFAVFWMFGAAGFRAPQFNQGFDFFPLFGIPFVLVGVGMLSSPVWMMWKSQRSAYVVTDRRAILFDGGLRSTTIRSFRRHQIGNLRRVQRSDGTGDLIFDQRSWTDTDGHRHQTDIGFLSIPDVRHVEQLINEISERD